MKLTVFGTGYVGLVQAAVLSEIGHDVCCVDTDKEKINKLKEGVVPIYEPGLPALIKNNTQNGKIFFTSSAKKGVNFGEVQFIAVGTPQDSDGSADLTYVLKVAETIAEFMEDEKIIIIKSTVPVGTANKVEELIESKLESKKNKIKFCVVSNPEFLKEGSAVEDCFKPDRIIIGIDKTKKQNSIQNKILQLYAPFNRNHDRIIFMETKSAELTKYAANAMLATKISFINEMANIAELMGADIEDIRKGIGSDSRIGYQFIYPGCGYGGSCFPKDLKALIRSSEEVGIDCKILNSVEEVNLMQKNKLFTFINDFFKGDLSGKTFTVWGLSFKPNTDDMREASSRYLMESLWNAGANVNAYDPKANKECLRIYGNRNDLQLFEDKQEALKNSNGLVICTEWKNFRAPDFKKIKDSLLSPVIFDGRNLFDPALMIEEGFDYFAIGRGLSVKN